MLVVIDQGCVKGVEAGYRMRRQAFAAVILPEVNPALSFLLSSLESLDVQRSENLAGTMEVPLGEHVPVALV
jgi:hypothetical protein